MIALLTAWIQSKLRLLEWAAFSLVVGMVFYLGYHTCYIIHEARINAKIEALPAKLIVDTANVHKAIKDSHDACVNAPIDPAIIKLLRH